MLHRLIQNPTKDTDMLLPLHENVFSASHKMCLHSKLSEGNAFSFKSNKFSH
jgi:hypothetical protein